MLWRFILICISKVKRFFGSQIDFFGDWIAKQTGADMLLYNGSCIVHEEFKVQALDDLMLEHPDTAVLVHPESTAEIINRADAVGSTSQLIAASQKLNNTKFIVAIDTGVFI